MRLNKQHGHRLLTHACSFGPSGLTSQQKVLASSAWRCLLLVANRNLESEDALEATIRREGTAQSLPVFTFAEADRVYQSATYLDKVVETLLDYLLNEANYRGTGRLFLP